MKIVFLYNNEISEPLIGWLTDVVREEVVPWQDKIEVKDILSLKPDLLISYNYYHILPQDILYLLPERVINMHISLLPWNRGPNPNIWSFLEDTPKGVTIHLMDKGMDTGDILVQKEVVFDEDRETLKSTYLALHDKMQSLFRQSWKKISNNELTPQPQSREGSIHYRKDYLRIREVMGEQMWDISILELKENYKKFIEK